MMYTGNLKLSDALDYIVKLRDDEVENLNEQFKNPQVWSDEITDKSISKIRSLNKDIKVLEDCIVALSITITDSIATVK
jgi:hypothetical protein